MKRLFESFNKILLLVMVSLIPSILFTNCAKDKQPVVVDIEPPVTIVLYDKPLTTIKQYVQGSWKLINARGGFTYTVYHCERCFLTINPDDTYICRRLSDKSEVDTLSIKWIKELGSFIPTYDSTYILHLYTLDGSRSVGWSFIIDRIDHDTLVMHDYNSEPIFYHYLKQTKK